MRAHGGWSSMGKHPIPMCRSHSIEEVLDLILEKKKSQKMENMSKIGRNRGLGIEAQIAAPIVVNSRDLWGRGVSRRTY